MKGGNFFSTLAYWSAVHPHPGLPFELENVEIDGHVLRLPTADGHVVANGPFLDYHEPLPAGAPVHRKGRWFAPCVAVKVAEVGPDDTPPTWHGKVAPYVALEGATFEEYCASLSPKRYKRDMEKRRKADRELGLVFTLNDPAAIEQAYAWKRAQFPDNKDLNDENLATLLAMRKALTVSTLRDRGGRLLAAAIGFIHDGWWGGLIYSHNPADELSKYSLGTQLYYEMIREAFSQGLREYDFLIGGEAYKWYFATHARLCDSIGRKPIMLRVGNALRVVRRTVKKLLPTWKGAPARA